MRLRTANNHQKLRVERGAILIRAKRRTRKQFYLMWSYKTADQILDDVQSMMMKLKELPSHDHPTPGAFTRRRRVP